MHPPLHVSKHPYCKKVQNSIQIYATEHNISLLINPLDFFPGSQEIEALVTCHSEHALAKFVGKCNQHKWDLDACFKREKALNR